jgi:hypothetical protein
VIFLAGVGLLSKTTLYKNIKVQELEFPVGTMPEVVDILMENDLENSLTGTDEDHDFI